MLRTNILVLGKSGAGKSSLLNYLWGDVIAKAGTGRPVTERQIGDEIGIYPSEPLVIGNLELVIYDSWGMEADKADEWNDIIRGESQKREQSNNIEDWFHAIIYCVSAKGARIEPFEIKQVVQPLIDAGHSVIFALTKCGVASEEERLRVREAIDAACPSHGGVIEVESVAAQLRGRASPTVTNGKNELIEAAQKNFVANLDNKLRAKYLAKCDAKLKSWKLSVLSLYDQKASLMKPTAVTLKEVDAKAVSWLDDCLTFLNKWREVQDKQASDFYKEFGSVLLQKSSVISQRFLSRGLSLNRGDLEWDGAHYAASVVMNIVPVLNVGYWYFRKELHRDALEEKLTDVVNAVNGQARVGLDKKDAYPRSVQFQERSATSEWDVYVDDKYVGTVREESEESARCAAYFWYHVEGAEISMSRR